MNMRYSKSRRSAFGPPRVRLMLLLAAVVLFVGLFVQISMLARISAQSKRAQALEAEIDVLSVSAENLELSINQYHNLQQIALLAEKLGMDQPDESQIRVISVARSASEATSTQTVEAIDGEKALN